jgi:transcriptional regulator with XRE-family HTH domain
MIDSRITGAYISHLRRDKDWTQMELADKLNISHQAVSRWEKGDSFPDITTLAQIAGLFGVSVDDLLNGGPTAGGAKRPATGKVLEELAHGHAETVARMVQEDPAHLTAVIDAAPFSRPSQINDVLTNLGEIRFTQEQVTGLAPFVSQEVLGTLVVQMEMDGLSLTGLAEIAPFMAMERLNALAIQIMPAEVPGADLVALAPFLSSIVCNQLAGRMAPAGLDGETLVALAPFLDREHIDRLTTNAAPGSIQSEHLAGLAPFLSRSRLGQLVTQVGPLAEMNDIIALAPFLEASVLETLIQPKR